MELGQQHLFLAAVTAVSVTVGMFPLIQWLQQRNLLDVPNARSSHENPTPRGGGLVIVPTLLVVWMIGIVTTGADFQKLIVATASVVMGSVVLFAVSWLDDIKGLSAGTRLMAQVLCVAVVLALLPTDLTVFDGALPLYIERVFLCIVWVWFINVFNFMDGIDGISAVQSTAICAGILVFSESSVALDPTIPMLSAVLIGAMAGFLPWNWHPAKIFLGDSGSAPIGFLLGWCLLSVALAGGWAVALILPAYYVGDAGTTMLYRLFRGERIWEAHREHAYQIASRRIGHARTSILVACIAALLIGVSALLVEQAPELATFSAILLVFVALLVLRRIA